MSLVPIEDQSPTMRRAKMRLVLAIVLLIVAIGGLISMGTESPPKVKVAAAQKPVKPRTRPASAAVTPKQVAAKAPAPVAIDGEPEAKPPQAPPDPVYTSFTADPAYVAANTPATTAVEADKPADKTADAPATPAVSQPPPQSKPEPKPIASAKTEDRIEASAGGKYLLQAGVFADMENARRQLEKLAQHHIDTHIESKVRIGPFANTGEVSSAKEKVEAAGINISLDEFDSAKGTMLQAGILTDMESAKQLQSKLQGLGFASRCETRILIGPFDTKAKTDAARSRIKALNISVVLM